MRNEKVFTDEEGNSRVVQYVELERIDGQVVAKEWTEETGKITERGPTPEEVDLIESADKEEIRQEALQVVEDAKNSDNPEIADLAQAFSKLIE